MSVPLSDFMGASMGKVREMIDVNTVVGDPIHTDDGVTIIPVSKVSSALPAARRSSVQTCTAGKIRLRRRHRRPA